MSSSFKGMIDFLKAKTHITTGSYYEIAAEAHDWAFTVAGLMEEDLLYDIQQKIIQAAEEGTPFSEFQEEFDKILDKAPMTGKNSSRTVYQTNMASAYNAGRYQELQEEDLPYWKYKHSHSAVNPREEHLDWDGLVLKSNDSWWQSHFPPNGYNCGCTVVGVTERGLKRMGKSEPDKAPPDDTEKVTVGGIDYEAHEGVDPLFNHIPGGTKTQKGLDAKWDGDIEHRSSSLMATGETKNAIYEYSKDNDGFATRANSFARGNKLTTPFSSQEKAMYDILERWLDNSCFLAYGTVYRALPLWILIQEGGFIQDPAFLSTTTTLEYAVQRAKDLREKAKKDGEDEPYVVLKISVPKYAKGASIRLYSNNPQENEILFQRNSGISYDLPSDVASGKFTDIPVLEAEMKI